MPAGPDPGRLDDGARYPLGFGRTTRRAPGGRAPFFIDPAIVRLRTRSRRIPASPPPDLSGPNASSNNAMAVVHKRNVNK